MTSPAPILSHHLKLKNIAVLTDLGANAEKPLRFAASLARQFGADLTVAHACAPDFNIYIPPEPLPYWPASGNSAKQRAEQSTRTLIGKAGLTGVSVNSLVSCASVPELLKELELQEPDLLVLATHARTGISRWLSGSVTADIFRRTQWPVLVLPPAALDNTPEKTHFQRILFATDLSEISARAFGYAAGIADDHRAQLVTVYVDVDGTAYSFERVIALQRLEDWLHRQFVIHPDLQHEPECVVRFGSPADEILELASEHNADLIVLGARGFGAAAGIASHFVGGTAYDVAGNSSCPVLIVPDAHH